MNNQPKLFMLMLGCKPAGRNTEQHDVFFGIGENLKSLVPNIKAFWRGAGTIHIDAYREVTHIDGFKITVSSEPQQNDHDLFFINLGGYRRGTFNELHECQLHIGETLAAAIKKSKQSNFYKTETVKGAPSHVDDKFAVDVDDACKVSEMVDLAAGKLSLKIERADENDVADELYIGYFKLDKLEGL